MFFKILVAIIEKILKYLLENLLIKVALSANRFSLNWKI